MNADGHKAPDAGTPDDFQKAWQAQSSQTRVTVDAGLLLKEVQRNEQVFRAMIFWRDFREVLAGVLMLPLWFYLGARSSSPWTWYLTVPAILWVIGFILVDRRWHPKTPSEPGDPLRKTVNESLTQVEHQIWLLRNVFWWYLLPFTIPVLAFFAQVTLQVSRGWLEALVAGGSSFALLLAVYWFLDYINQRAVRVQLEPRRQELLALLKSLNDETTSEDTANSAESFESPRIFRRWLVVTVLAFVSLVLLILASRLFGSSYDGPPQIDGPAGAALGKVVAEQRKEKNLVGLAAMVTIDGQLEAAAVVGERKQGSGVPLEISDRWHLGGITKSITATMIARLVEAGRMQWTDTVGETFPEASIHEDWKPVTLRQLLTDTAGAPANFPRSLWLQRPAPGAQRTLARREAVLNVMADPPAYPPGEKYAYSNVGYSIVGAMAEKVTGASWEDLVKREVFEPLNLTDAGFGPPQSGDETLEQPRGHRAALVGKVSVDDQADNTPIMGPAGTVHMKLDNLCTFAAEHLRGDRGEGKLLSAETYKLLHTPALDYYACGWIRKEPGEVIPHTVFWHNGANTLWYALVVFIPEKKMVIAVTSNDGDADQAEAAAWEIVRAGMKQFNVAADPPRREPQQGAVYPKKSPFAAVRWQQSQPEVKVGDEWFKLVSLDELPAAEIVDFSQRTNGHQWQKRFEEDLVELLSRMGHPPGDTVKLVVQSLTSAETQVLNDVPMTTANRQAIKAAAQSRANTHP